VCKSGRGEENRDGCPEGQSLIVMQKYKHVFQRRH